MTPEERAHWYEHSAPECEVPGCSCCPDLAQVIREAEAAAYLRGREEMREEAAHVSESGMGREYHELPRDIAEDIRSIPLEKQPSSDSAGGGK